MNKKIDIKAVEEWVAVKMYSDTNSKLDSIYHLNGKYKRRIRNKIRLKRITKDWLS